MARGVHLFFRTRKLAIIVCPLVRHSKQRCNRCEAGTFIHVTICTNCRLCSSRRRHLLPARRRRGRKKLSSKSSNDGPSREAIFTSRRLQINSHCILIGARPRTGNGSRRNSEQVRWKRGHTLFGVRRTIRHLERPQCRMSAGVLVLSCVQVHFFLAIKLTSHTVPSSLDLFSFLIY